MKSITADPSLLAFCDALDCFVRQRFAYKAPLANWNWGSTVNVNRAKVHLYLRLCPPSRQLSGGWPEKTLVIAAIQFREQRTGHGRALLEFLVHQAARFGYDKIGVEETHDGDNIQGFVKKYGMEPAHADSDRPTAHWIAPVSRVAFCLDKTGPQRHAA